MELGNSTSIVGSTSGSPYSANIQGSNSDMSYHGDDNNGDDAGDDGSYISDYDDNDDYMFDNDVDYGYSNIQAQFDNVDFPPGVEISFSWMKHTTPSINVTSNNAVVLPTASGSGTETSVAIVPDIANSNNNTAASSSSTFPAALDSDGKEEVEKEHDIMKNYQSFKRFDIVNDFLDHHYSRVGFQVQQVTSILITPSYNECI